LQNAIQELPHCAEPIHLLIQLSLSLPRQFLPPSGGWNARSEAMHQTTRRIQTEPTLLR
jgi:hypothetical protein